MVARRFAFALVAIDRGFDHARNQGLRDVDVIDAQTLVPLEHAGAVVPPGELPRQVVAQPERIEVFVGAILNEPQATAPTEEDLQRALDFAFAEREA